MEHMYRVPVVEVDQSNRVEVWPSLLNAVRNATFIAIDCELSGLGDRNKLKAKDVEDRYKSIRDAAQSRAIISIGLSCFHYKNNENTAANSESHSPAEDHIKGKSGGNHNMQFTTQTFNVLTMCKQSYMVDTESVQFLVKHGFDFNKQFSQGISYSRGPDKVDSELTASPLRHIFAIIALQNKPIVFHNGLVDVVYLYQALHTTLPSSLSVFIADLNDLLPGGIYDTKYVTEYHARYPASFLEYVFKRCQRESSDGDGKCGMSVSFLSYPESCHYITYHDNHSTQRTTQQKHKVCRMWATYGFCDKGQECPEAHSVDMILDNEELVVAKMFDKDNRKRKHFNLIQSADSDDDEEEEEEGDEKGSILEKSVDGIASDDVTDSVANQCSIQTKDTDSNISKPANGANAGDSSSKHCAHSAGIDAFMTGFIFAHFICEFGDKSKLPDATSIDDMGVEEMRNKMALNGKDVPLTVMKSSYGKLSKSHQERINRLRSQNIFNTYVKEPI